MPAFNKANLLHSAQRSMIKSEFFVNRAMDDILFGRETTLASQFKEHLIYDEQCEFLNRFLTTRECQKFITKKANYCHKITTDFAAQAKMSSDKINNYRLQLRGLRPTYYNL